MPSRPPVPLRVPADESAAFPPEVRLQALWRARYACERCGFTEVQLQARRPVSDPASLRPENVLCLCGICAAWLAANPEHARAFGYMIPPDADPMMAPVVIVERGLCLLTATEYIPVKMRAQVSAA